MRARIRRVFLILTAALALGSGKPGPAAAQSAEAEVVAAYVAAYNRHDVAAMLALADSSIEWLSVSGAQVTVESRGAGALRQGLESYFRSLPSARSEILQQMSAGPYVTTQELALWEGRDGAPRSQWALAVYEVRGGKVLRVWYYPVERQR